MSAPDTTNENTEKPFIRNAGKFRRSNGGNAINLHLNRKFYVIPITELNSVLAGEQETGNIREYMIKKEWKRNGKSSR